MISILHIQDACTVLYTVQYCRLRELRESEEKVAKKAFSDLFNFCGIKITFYLYFCLRDILYLSVHKNGYAFRGVPVVDTVYSIMHCLFKLYVLVFYNLITVYLK